MKIQAAWREIQAATYRYKNLKFWWDQDAHNLLGCPAFVELQVYESDDAVWATILGHSMAVKRGVTQSVKQIAGAYKVQMNLSEVKRPIEVALLTGIKDQFTARNVHTNTEAKTITVN